MNRLEVRKKCWCICNGPRTVHCVTCPKGMRTAAGVCRWESHINPCTESWTQESGLCDEHHERVKRWPNSSWK